MPRKVFLITRWKTAVTCVLMAMLLAPAFSHDTWLSVRRASVAVGADVTLDLTSGMTFPLLAYPINVERIEQAGYRLGGKTTELTERHASTRSLRLTTRFTAPGIAVLWVQLKPKVLELTPSKVAEYLDEIGASPEIHQAWAQAKPRRWREVYAKHAKTFVRVGASAQDQSWAESVGLGLEIVPEKDPTQLQAGDEFPVRVLRHGQPFANFPLGIIREKAAHGVIQKTDAEGRTVFKLHQAGQWLVRGTDLRKSSVPNTDWESDFTTLTIAVHTR